MKAVIADSLSKTYTQGKKAVQSISFSLDQGEVFGFLGPNGAGKTTTVKLLGGMLAPTEGTCRVLDMDPSAAPEKIHQVAGVVTEHAQMYDNLTGLQNLVFYGTLFGVSRGESEKRARRLLDTLGLSDAQDRKLATYSTGMRQRLSLARAMIHQPKILFLDEPTSGLDPESTQSVNHMIKRLAQEEGITVFLCTHQLRYAQEICNAYGLIDEGMLLASGSIEALRAMVFSGLTVSIRTDRFPAELPCRKIGERQFEIQVASEAEIPPVVRRIVEEGGSVYHVSAKSLSLEEIYFALLEKRNQRKEG
ncbi:MAG TPA: ABC transporter ATP-binding protein [Clostridia bacterium]|nr:ABC transporter ATP-binding protein [Clostridia bacterium]